MKKIIFVLVAGAVIASVLTKGPEIMSISGWLPEKPDAGVLSGDSSAHEFHRYRDEQGNWQYRNRPLEGANVERVSVGSSNSIESIEIQPEKTIAVRTPAPGVADYVENMQDAQRDAEAVQQLMDDREAQLRETLNHSQ